MAQDVFDWAVRKVMNAKFDFTTTVIIGVAVSAMWTVFNVFLFEDILRQLKAQTQ